MRSAHELIPSTNCVDAHVQDTAVNDELLLNTLQAFAERPGSLQATRNSCLFQSVGSSKTVRRSYQQQYCITPYSQELPPPAKLILRSMFSMYTKQKKRRHICSNSKSPVWERSKTKTKIKRKQQQQNIEQAAGVISPADLSNTGWHKFQNPDCFNKAHLFLCFSSATSWNYRAWRCNSIYS